MSEQSQWINVKERLPNRGVKIIGLKVYTDARKAPVVSMYYFMPDHDFPWRDGFGGGDGPSVTHWMPLPAPPEGEV